MVKPEVKFNLRLDQFLFFNYVMLNSLLKCDLYFTL